MEEQVEEDEDEEAESARRLTEILQVDPQSNGTVCHLEDVEGPKCGDEMRGEEMRDGDDKGMTKSDEMRLD